MKFPLLTLILTFFFGVSFFSSCYSTAVKEDDPGYVFYQKLSSTSSADVKDFLEEASRPEIRKILASTHNPFGMGAVALVLQESHPDLLPVLIETYKADVDQVGLGGFTAPHVAVLRKMLPALEDLVGKYHATPTLLTEEQENLLHLALGSWHNPTLPFLISHFPEMLDQKDKAGNFPLFYAVKTQDLWALRQLSRVEKKAHVMSKNLEGFSPLSYSIQMNYDEITALLQKIR